MKINGKPVEDAKRPLRISINDEDARLGKNKNPSGCAAARAIMRMYKPAGAKQARVHLGRVYVEYPEKWVRYMTPNTLKAEIVSFDRGSKAQYMVGEYKLSVPPPSNTLGSHPGFKPTGKNKHRAHIARARHQIEGVRARGANR